MIAENRPGGADGVTVGLHGVLDDLAISPAQRDDHRKAGVPARLDDEFVAAAQTLVGQAEAAQPVPFMRIYPGKVEDQAGTELG